MKARFCLVCFFTLLLIIFSKSGISQISTSFYYSSYSKIGVAYNFSDRLWSELRLYNSDEFSDITSELILNYNVVKKERHNIYIGIGGMIKMDYGALVIPIGTQFYPIKDFKKFSVHIELLPTLIVGDEIQLNSALGIRYLFNNRKEKNQLID
ncbi:MAG: hypothetical protein JXR31_06030 [Prolixibacteraceae bacterium]|nr:hypothetical protein [Prolixibacteraceae bacterium]MBN2773787.1 hypothetical protein [Prolixibacteraceae bacterium]